MIGRRLGRYEILAKLGEGGMGVVYKAHDTLLNRAVAVKILPHESLADPTRKQRFTQEAQAASALNHPNIVTIYDIAQADGIDFIAMEYVQGKPLAELIGRHGLRLKDTLTFGMQSAGALAKAHATGIIHRDLKPSNLMVTDDGVVKILDFGVAKLLASRDVGDEPRAAAETMTAGDRLETMAGTIVGTAAYMSPEQAEGRKVDARSDIFSFGTVLYEMATGVRVFQRSSATLTLAAVVNEEPQAPGALSKDLPHELERTILRCLKKDPARRFQGMADLAVELDEIRTETGTHAPTARTSSSTGRTRWALVAAGIVALAATVAWWRWPAASEPTAAARVVPLTALRGLEFSPSLSPDGSQIAFTWSGENLDNYDVYVMPIGAATPVRLTTDPAEDDAAEWSPDGTEIAFVRWLGNDASIYLTPPTPNSERKIADVRRVRTTNNDFTTISWFPDGRYLAVAESDTDRKMNGIVAIPVGRGERKRIVWTDVPSGTYNYPAISPSGNTLAYAFCHGGFSCDVYTLDLAEDFTPKGEPRRLTQQNATANSIFWAPDGRSIIYGSSSVAVSSVWRVSLDGRLPERVELAGARALSPVLSRDGSMLAYTHYAYEWDIWMLDPSGPKTFLSSSLSELNPRFSPDGRKIVFESDRLGTTQQLWVANADGTNPVPLNKGSERIHGSAYWSPDSRWIVFDGRESEQERTGIYIVDAAGGQPRHLTTPGSIPSWSRDGTWIYFGKQGQTWKISPQGGEAMQVTEKGGTDAMESPDGKTLYYRKSAPVAGTPTSLFSRPVGGGEERLVLDSLLKPGGPRQFVPMDDGVYYVTMPDLKTLTAEVRFLNVATGRQETVRRFDAAAGYGLTVSPDRKTILYSGIRPDAGSDLMLIRNFR